MANNMEGNMENTNRSAKILHYAAICAEELSSTNPETLSRISDEKREIEQQLGMSLEEIIFEARKLSVVD